MCRILDHICLNPFNGSPKFTRLSTPPKTSKLTKSLSDLCQEKATYISIPPYPICASICLFMYSLVCLFVCLLACLLACLLVGLHIYIYTYISRSAHYVCLSIRTCIHVYIYIYIYVYIQILIPGEPRRRRPTSPGSRRAASAGATRSPWARPRRRRCWWRSWTAPWSAQNRDLGAT